MPIPVDLRNMIHKGQSVGCSEGFWRQHSITTDDLLLQGKATLHVGKHLGGCHNLPELMLSVAFIHEAEILRAKQEELLDILVFDERLPDVVNLKAAVLSVFVLNEKNARNRKATGRNIQILPGRAEPNGMKLGLDVNLGALPNCPPKYGPSAVFCNARIDDREALILRRALGRRAPDVKRRNVCSPEHLAGESFDVRFDELGRAHEQSNVELTGGALAPSSDRRERG